MCLGSAIAKKVKKLDKIDQEIIQVSPISSDMFNLCMTVYFLENLIARIRGDGRMVSKVSPPVLIFLHPVHQQGIRYI